MAADETAFDAFDPLSEGRAGGDTAPRVTLLQRGKVLQQLREELRRRESYSVNTRRVSIALLGSQMRKPMSTRRLLLDASDATPTISEDLAGVSLSVVGAKGASLDGSVEANTLVRSAVLALWTNFRLATGLRRWKEAAQEPPDISRFGSDIDLNIEARKILVSAESELLAALHHSQTHLSPLAARSHDEDELIVSPRALDTTGIRHSRPELDLLTVWAKQLQSKTFRSVDDVSICEVMRFMRFRKYQDGDTLFYEGEAGETFYIIFQGTIAVFVGMSAPVKAKLSALHYDNVDAHVDWTQLGKRVFTYRTGDSFGETAMFSNDATRTASAVAVGPCEVCELHRDIYRRTLRKYHQQFFEQAQKLNFLQRVPLFRDLQRHKLTALADVLEKKRFDFGDAIVTEKSGALRACYLVLSGVVKLTQSVEVPATSHHVTPVEAAGSIKRKKPVIHLKVELQSIVSNEIVALEAVVDPLVHPQAAYSATVASAHAEVYVLRESDARGFIGGTHSALGQRIRHQCEAEAAHRERRHRHTRQTLLYNMEDAADAEEEAHGVTSTVEGDSLDVAVASPESPRSGRRNDGVVPGLQVTTRPPAISEGGAAPYLPNLRASRLFPTSSRGSVLLSPRGAGGAAASIASDLGVVSSPKMLSSCVRKFLFDHSDTLADDYLERLRHQFPSPPAPLLADAMVASSRAQRDEQRVLAQQLSKMYDSKMHWDAKKKDFVVASATTTNSSGHATPRAGFLSSTPRSSSASHDASVLLAASRPPTSETPEQRRRSAERKSAFHQELRSTQQAARKLVETHLSRVGHKPADTRGGAEGAGRKGAGREGAFLHFFADS